MPTTFWDSWLEEKAPADANSPANIRLFVEKSGGRAATSIALQEAVKDHFVGLEIIERMGGFPSALGVLRNSLPTEKATRSGDMGELLATEYIIQKTTFIVPIKRLRHKEDRRLAMRGDDVIAIRLDPVPTILKVESKSKGTLSSSVVGEAATQLSANAGRPNPSTLAFIAKRLRGEGSGDAIAEFIEKVLAGTITAPHIEHHIFTFSGNDAESALTAYAGPSATPLTLVGLTVTDHQDFIKQVFETAHA